MRVLILSLCVIAALLVGTALGDDRNSVIERRMRDHRFPRRRNFAAIGDDHDDDNGDDNDDDNRSRETLQNSIVGVGFAKYLLPPTRATVVGMIEVNSETLTNCTDRDTRRCAYERVREVMNTVRDQLKNLSLNTTTTNTNTTTRRRFRDNQLGRVVFGDVRMRPAWLRDARRRRREHRYRDNDSMDTDRGNRNPGFIAMAPMMLEVLTTDLGLVLRKGAELHRNNLTDCKLKSIVFTARPEDAEGVRGLLMERATMRAVKQARAVYDALGYTNALQNKTLREKMKVKMYNTQSQFDAPALMKLVGATETAESNATNPDEANTRIDVLVQNVLIIQRVFVAYTAGSLNSAADNSSNATIPEAEPRNINETVAANSSAPASILATLPPYYDHDEHYYPNNDMMSPFF